LIDKILLEYITVQTQVDTNTLSTAFLVGRADVGKLCVPVLSFTVPTSYLQRQGKNNRKKNEKKGQGTGE